VANIACAPGSASLRETLMIFFCLLDEVAYDALRASLSSIDLSQFSTQIHE
jgi:hypothetical protein